MRMAIVSSYPPRPCGIAVFSADLRTGLLEVDRSLTVDVVAITPRGGRPSQMPEVIGTIRQEVAGDYAAAAAALGERDLDVVLIEHEFGIFGGDAGRDILVLAENLTVPIVVTLHTVLAEPSSSQSTTLRSLCARA